MVTSADRIGCPVLGLFPRIPILLSANSRDNVGEHNNLAASL